MRSYRVAIIIQGHIVPSSRFRILQYIPYLESVGIQCDIYAPKFPPSGFSSKIIPWKFYHFAKHISQLLLYIPSRLAQLLMVIRKNYDTIFIQKPLMEWPYLPMLEYLLYKQGQKIIFDLDDALYSKSNVQNRYIDVISTLSNHIIVGNENLAAVLQKTGNNISIIPTTVDEARYISSNKNKSNNVCIGWTGTSSNLKYLIGIAPSLEKLSSNPRVRIKVISDVANVPALSRITNIIFCRWNLGQEIEQLSEFDIGLMPLTEDAWTTGKCGFKLIQYMAMGIPSVCSPVGANREIIQEGHTGYHANTEQEWIDRLDFLVRNEGARIEMGRNALLDYRSRFSLEQNAKLIANVIKQSCAEDSFEKYY